MHYRAAPIPSHVYFFFRYIVRYLLAGLLLGAMLDASAQAEGEGLKAADEQLAAAVAQHAAKISGQIRKEGLRSLRAIEAAEKTVLKKLAAKDPLGSVALSGDLQSRYASLQGMLEGGGEKLSTTQVAYVPVLDSLQAAAAFLQSGHALAALQDRIGILQQALDRQQAVGKLLEQRRRVLEELLVKYRMPGELKKLRNRARAYQEGLRSYTAMLSDPAGLESNVIKLVRQVPQFQPFFRAHSQLAALMPGGSEGGANSPGKLTAGQNREAVMASVVQRKGSAAEVYQVLQQASAPTLEGELNRRLSAFRKKGASGMGEALPAPSPGNRQLGSRLVYGFSLQTRKGNRLFPASGDLSFTIGYRILAKYIIGAGASYTSGFVPDLRKFRISNEGIGLRTFIDHRVNGKIWISGGADLRYQYRFRNAELFRNRLLWQKSAWVGVGRTYRVSNRVNGRLQLVYDALWKQHVPVSQPVFFRLGYQWQ